MQEDGLPKRKSFDPREMPAALCPMCGDEKLELVKSCNELNTLVEIFRCEECPSLIVKVNGVRVYPIVASE